MFFNSTALLAMLGLLATSATAEPVSLNPPLPLTDVVRCSELEFAEHIVKAFRVSATAGQITIDSYANQMNQFGLRHCNRVERQLILIGQIEMNAKRQRIGNGDVLIIVEVRLGLHPKDVDDVGFVIMTDEQYETLTTGLL